MTRKLFTAIAILTAWAVALAVAALLATPALAHHKEGHASGGGSSQGSPGTTSECEQPSLHPSGKDRCEEPGGSGTQGNAKSDPDDDGRGPDRSNGGPDKPGGSGGTYKSDQDNNNGCGNDQDFEDDNEGLCLGPVKRQNDKPRPTRSSPPSNPSRVEDQTRPSAPSNPSPPSIPPGLEHELSVVPDQPEGEDETEGEILIRPAAPEDEAAPEVAGKRVIASPPRAVTAAVEKLGAVLPSTGASIAFFLLAGLGLIGSGAALARFRR